MAYGRFSSKCEEETKPVTTTCPLHSLSNFGGGAIEWDAQHHQAFFNESAEVTLPFHWAIFGC